jgi:osmotically-inducible protein OsmY
MIQLRAGADGECAMADKAEILESVRAALYSEPRVDLHNHPIAMDFDDGTLTLEGEVARVAAKKLALEAAVTVPEVTGIIDRLRVTPAQPMGDGEIRSLVRDSLLQEPAFAEYAIEERVKGGVVTVRASPIDTRGYIEVAVDDGIVTLNGEVPGLDDKRLAGVLAWWVPGSRDVINGLAVEPPEDDSFDMIAEAVRLVLEKDPYVDAGQIRVGVRDRVVTLAGLLPSESQRDMAECDAWYVFGVDRVVNKIEVHWY